MAASNHALSTLDLRTTVVQLGQYLAVTSFMLKSFWKAKTYARLGDADFYKDTTYSRLH